MKFLADEDLRRAIFDGVRRKLPNLDFIRVQDAGFRSFRDEIILQHAATAGRIVLSQDVSTMKVQAERRILTGKPMPGIVLIPDHLPVGRAIEDIVLIATVSREDEWAGRIQYLPL